MSRDPHKYRELRRFWWLRPVVILPAIGLTLLSLPMLWWIDTYGSLAADIMFELTYVSLVGWFIYLSKGTLLDPNVRQKKEALQRTKEEIAEHRLKERAKIYATELQMLKNGEVTPVLDVWRLDASLRSKHPLIALFHVCRIDPVAREFEITLQLDKNWTFTPESKQTEKLINQINSFLRFLSKETDVTLFRPFADTLYLEVFKLRDDGSLHGEPVCVASICATFAEIDGLIHQPASKELPGDVKMSGGDEVVPHRFIG